MIREVFGQYNPKKLEEEVRSFWEKNRIPKKIQRKKGKKFYLLDGPPYVNQVAHVGHIKTRAMKDIWVKFKSMQGFNVWLQPGFDCHGLPIENVVEKELGIKSKKDIEVMGVKKFIEACRKKAEGTEEEWLKLYKFLGDWRGWYEPYLTFKNYYIQSAWWTVKNLFEKGMVVEGEKPTYWCPRCQTALAGYEVTDSYAEVKDPYIYVKFPIKGKSNEFIIIATTTPWTLISNVAIAVHPEEYYVRAKVGKEVYILSEKTVEKVLKQLCKLDYEIESKFLGKELEGIKYSPVLDVPVQEKLEKNESAHRIILSIPVLKSKSYKHGVIEKAKEMKEEFFDFVVAGEGSGCVHCAPGHGPEDYYVGQHYNLPSVSPVDDEGKLTNDAGEFRGMFVKDADKKIIEKLKKKKLLLYFDWITHSYPLCWRCKSILIYRLTKQWFFSVDVIKDKMLKENEKVRWLPGFARESFRKWLSDAVDWCISRQRYWGIPLPIWICEKCGKREVVGSVEELKEKAREKLPKNLDLHKHFVDKITLTCKNCNSIMRRVPDIMDVWFDSGIAPWASLGYPFKNKEVFEQIWPCDLVCESQDQIRGWFYSLMFCGVAAFGISPYKAVAMMGWVLDEKGEKMSKSLGNVIWAQEALEKLGADILRLYLCWEVAPWEVQKFSFKTAEEIRRTLNILWNSYSFFTTYCTEDFKPNFSNLLPEDKWLLSRLNSLIEDVTKGYENFEFHKVARMLVDFITNDLSRFYIKLVRDRVWVSKNDESKVSALSALYETLVKISKLLAPITPYISEEIYQNLVLGLDPKSPCSVHLTSWPEVDKAMIDKNLEEGFKVIKKIIDASNSARQLAKMRLRWPIKRLVVITKEKKVQEIVEKFAGILSKACNAKLVLASEEELKGDFSKAEFDFGFVLVDKERDEEMKKEAMIRELIRKIQDTRKKEGLKVKDLILLFLDSNANDVLSKYKNILKEETGSKEVIIGKVEEFKTKFDFENFEVKIGFKKI
jgi:isoleucyl-tRNA synthetase